MPQSQPAMSLKLLSLRREGEDLQPDEAEMQIRLSGNDGTTPWSGHLTVRVPSTVVQTYLNTGVPGLAETAWKLLADSYRLVRNVGGDPRIE